MNGAAGEKESYGGSVYGLSSKGRKKGIGDDRKRGYLGKGEIAVFSYRFCIESMGSPPPFFSPRILFFYRPPAGMISPLGFPAFKSAFVCLFCLTVVSLLVASFHRGTLYLWTDCV